MGWEASPKARAKSAERALETALLNRFGWVGGAPAVLKLRSDNGLVFASKLHRGLCREYGLAQEFITPYTPEENGLVERFMRSLKEERAWLHNVSSLEEAREVIRNWVAWHDTERPRQTLNYKTPQEARKERENQPRELSKNGGTLQSPTLLRAWTERSKPRMPSFTLNPNKNYLLSTKREELAGKKRVQLAFFRDKRKAV